jgi:hypothetical protein
MERKSQRKAQSAFGVRRRVFGLRAVDRSVVFVRTSPFDPPGDLRFSTANGERRTPRAWRGAYLLKFDRRMDIVFLGLKKLFKPIGVMTFAIISPF